jgi:hypothetical protein
VGGGRPRASHSVVWHLLLGHHHASSPATVAIAPNGGNSSDNETMRGVDSNLAALCEHVQVEGWKSKAFSDIVVKAMGHTFHLHRLLLSRSSYFRSGLMSF